MQCPECQSTHSRQNGKKKDKQNHICAECGRQFIDQYDEVGYSNEFKHKCLKMYVNGMGFRAIERVKGVHHTTVINWVKQVGELLPDAYDPENIPQVGGLDELQTFVSSKSGCEPASLCGDRECSPRQKAECIRLFAINCHLTLEHTDWHVLSQPLLLQ